MELRNISPPGNYVTKPPRNYAFFHKFEVYLTETVTQSEELPLIGVVNIFPATVTIVRIAGAVG